MRRVRRGVTLMELLVGFGLVSFILITAMPNLGRSRSSTKAAAQVMATVLQEARQRAINQGVPVAVVVPSDNGTYGHSSAYYILEGEQPRVTRVVDLSREQPGVGLFVGSWPVNSAVLSDPTALPTVSLPQVHQFEGAFEVGKWQMPEPKDYAFIFAPSGKFYSNGLPHFDGATHLVVTQGVEASAGSSPGGTPPVSKAPNVFQPLRLGSPYTIDITPLGQVTVHTGLNGTDGSVTVGSEAPRRVGATPPTVSSAGPNAPKTVSVETTPELVGGPVEPGSPEPMLLDEPVTLVVTAKGDGPLFSEWAGPSGQFSNLGPTKMDYDEDSDSWTSRWTYQASSGLSVGDEIELTLTVTDAQGRVAPAVSPVKFIIEAPGPELTFTTTPYKWHVSRANGRSGQVFNTRFKEVTWRAVTLSPDASKMVVSTAGVSAGRNNQIAVLDREGKDVCWSRDIRTGALEHVVWLAKYSWNPQGTRIAVNTELYATQSQRNVPTDLLVANLVGRGSGGLQVQKVLDDIDFSSPCSWSPDGERVCARLFNGRVVVVKHDGTDLVYLPGLFEVGPFSPDGSMLVGNTGGRSGQLGYVAADGSGGFIQIPGARGFRALKWSDDGQSVLTVSGSRTGGQALWIRLDGTPVSSGFPSSAQPFTLSSDGRFALTRSGRDVGVQALDGSVDYQIPSTHRSVRLTGAES